MGETSTRPSPQVVGREQELALLRASLGPGAPTPAVIVTGGPGIGKTTLWEAGVASARAEGFQVLWTRASDAETQLSFAALIGLLDRVDVGALPALPPPQRRALEVALLRAEPAGAPPEPEAIAIGFLNTMRSLAAERPVLVAIDDVTWVDPPSADALAFAARRIEGEPIGFLLTRRPGRPSPVERAFGPRRLERVEVGPLSLGAIRLLLAERLGLALPRRLLRRLVETTLGNPLFALEVGRALSEHGLPPVGEDLPVPDSLEDLLGTRVTRLRGPVRKLLLAIALGGDLTRSQLVELAGTAAVDEALDAGLLLLDGDRVRASHPLLPAAARKHSRAGARRELHLELASMVAEEELKARHLALATGHPDEELAGVVAAAATAASARGARQEAVELAEHALELTPPASPQRSERVLALGFSLQEAGEDERLRDLLAREFPSIPAGPPRARAWMLRAEGVRDLDQYREYLERALAEARNDPALRARVVAKASSAVIAVERIPEAEVGTLEVLPDAEWAGPDVERAVLFALAWARALRGRPVDDICERFAAASGSPGYLAESPERVAGQRLVWRGQVDEARPRFERLLELADERGEVGSYAWGQLHLCELELRVGNWPSAARLLEEAERGPEGELFISPVFQRCRALLEAGRGVPEEAERWAAESIASAEAVGMQWEWLEALRARGSAALLAHEPARAAESLRTVWEHTRREGVDEPGVFPVAPDLVEALVELGRLDEARAVADRLRTLAKRHAHPWGLATAKRCAAAIQLATEYREEAAAALVEAAAEYGELGLAFDRARTLLFLGRMRRRSKKRAAARDSLEQAAEAFENLGSPGWAREARDQLGRLGKPAAGRDQLTTAERRVVELAADGLSNKEIARRLFVSVHTVEVHLSHAYPKLGVRSRAQLASRLRASG